MVTVSSPSNTGANGIYDFNGLSTDSKPTKTQYPDMANGSTFMEIDTKVLKFYDAENETWV